jgi:hypothetical protein
MTTKRIVKVDRDIRLIEVTVSDGTQIINRGYAVSARDPGDHETFGDMGAASVYFDSLVLRRLNPPK